MEISEALLDRIGRLAQIELCPEERDALRRNLDNVTEWASVLQEVETHQIEPLITTACDQDVFAQDIDTVPLSHQRALQNAPDENTGYFRVPKVKS